MSLFNFLQYALIDGLGGEEINVSGANLNAQSAFFLGSVTTTSQISGLNIFATGSTTTGRLIGATVVSGTSIFATGSLTGLRVTDENGRIFTIPHGSPGRFGAYFQAGSFATGAGSTATVDFRNNFLAANAYVFWAFPQSGPSLANAASGASAMAFTSGTANNGRNDSGANVVGAASTTYDYIAVGVI